MSFDPNPPVKKKSKLPLILGILGIGAVLCAACCGGCVYFGVQQAKAPLDATVAAMTENAELAEKLGTPIEASFNGIELRNFTNNNGNGGADLTFNATGPNGSAKVDTKLTLTAGKWTIDTLTATCSDGSTVTIP
ncbi:MAG: cytochrome c oxidase assembly factor Coa1 family protein [Planctomycetaceae bacterium]